MLSQHLHKNTLMRQTVTLSRTDLHMDECDQRSVSAPCWSLSSARARARVHTHTHTLKSLAEGAFGYNGRSAQSWSEKQTLVYLISGLGTGEGISWRDAMRAAGSLFSSPGISISLEVIAAVSPLVCAAPHRVIFFLLFWSGLRVPSWVYSQVSAAVHFHWAKKRAVLLKIKFAHLHKRSQPCVLRRRNTSTPPTSHSAALTHQALLQNCGLSKNSAQRTS